MRRRETAIGLLVILALGALNIVQWRRGAQEPSQREMIDAFTIVWAESKAVFHNRWLGLPTVQNPMDVWITQEIIAEVRPDVILETGTFLGGSAALWATILEQVTPAGRVITIDVVDRSAEAKRVPVVQRHVDFLVGSSTDPAIVGEVRRRVEGKRVMVILDSDHAKAHVLAELRAYAPLVQAGSYIVVQDTIATHPVTPPELPAGYEGPWEAVHAFLAETDDWEIDRGRERLLLTNNPDGYLRRVE